MAFRLVALALLSSTSIHSKPINTLAGPYKIVVERFYTCQPDDRVPSWSWYMRASHFNPMKPKELQRVTGNFTIKPGPLDNSLWGKANMGVRSNNQWKENAFVGIFKNSACRHLKENIPGFFNAFFQSTETKGVCSVKPGTYEINDVPIDWTFPKIPIMPYAHYRFNVSFGKDDILLGCFVVENRVIPKPE
ncbi:uncharacterized protein LOC127749464 [Frankliniella occidentalis]|uniref:Uncharacterized protein LOC127749464 n=1 Tax=Frankliniella occidentalis TaxID=133901 RepID=A0A9C6U010_FRAOC|nr:uncharacterized protein LOC127749464 [Frankliniella occidentalis]